MQRERAGHFPNTEYLSEVIWKGSIERDAELQKFEQLKLETSFKHENVTRSKENKQ
jgi:hypothetical protein